jgi:hypothetical protein
VCTKLNDGLSIEEVCNYLPINDGYSKQFIHCIDFAIENKWLKKNNKHDRYSLTKLGREIVNIKFAQQFEQLRIT